MFRFIAFLGIAFAAALSCSARYEPDPKFAPASREMEPGERLAHHAMQAIADARCDQDVICDQVGRDGRYPNRDACVNSVRARGFEDLGLDQCGAIDREQLSTCLNSIRLLGCSSSPEEVYLLNACQPSILCRGQ